MTSQSLLDNVVRSSEDMRSALTEKAVEDDTFRQLLVSDPKAAIHQEFGLEIPDYINVVVHESTVQDLHLSLPPASLDLNEEQLEAVAAGLSCCG